MNTKWSKKKIGLFLFGGYCILLASLVDLHISNPEMNQLERLKGLIEEYEPDGLSILIKEDDCVSWGDIKGIVEQLEDYLRRENG